MPFKTSNFFVINLIIREANSDKDLSPEEYSRLFLEFVQHPISGKSTRGRGLRTIFCPSSRPEIKYCSYL
jgi:hypothetical protein